MTGESNQVRHTRVGIEGPQWRINGQITYAGAPAEGLLMNVRMVNATFEDAHAEAMRHLPADFNAEANTDALVARIPEYVNSGIKALTLCLQGGFPGYEGAVNSALAADGTLHARYMRRIQKVVETCDRQGAAVILSCFYQRQKEVLQGRAAIKAAVRNTARWVRDSGYKNVVLEVSNEYAHGGYCDWKDGDWLASPEGQVELMRVARDAAPGLLVSTSGMGDGTVNEAIAGAADFLLIHLNGTPLGEFAARLELARRYGKPVVCNEDDKTGLAGAAAARLCVENGVSWGFMHNEKNQYVPFEFDGPADDPLVYAEIRRLTRPGTTGKAARGELPQQVLITRPHDGASVALGQALVIEVSASAGVREIQFFAVGRPIGRLTASPWQLQWVADEDGRYDLTVRASFADGTTVASHPINVIVSRSSK